MPRWKDTEGIYSIEDILYEQKKVALSNNYFKIYI